LTALARIFALTPGAYEGVSDLPGIRLRHLPDPASELGTGVYIDFKSKEHRDRFMEFMKTEKRPSMPTVRLGHSARAGVHRE
jgi:hypothetical protein